MINLRTLTLAALAIAAAASLGACKPKPANTVNSAEAANIATNEATATEAAPSDTSSKTTSKEPQQ